MINSLTAGCAAVPKLIKAWSVMQAAKKTEDFWSSLAELPGGCREYLCFVSLGRLRLTLGLSDAITQYFVAPCCGTTFLIYIFSILIFLYLCNKLFL